MPTVTHFRDQSIAAHKRGAIVAFPSGEDCALLFSRRGVRVRRAIVGPFGPSLYREPDNAKVTVMALMLNEMYPESLLPPGFIDFNLRAFTNAALHCRSCGAVGGLFQSIVKRPGQTWPPPPWWNSDWMSRS